jgi:hypothetical protein
MLSELSFGADRPAAFFSPPHLRVWLRLCGLSGIQAPQAFVVSSALFQCFPDEPGVGDAPLFGSGIQCGQQLPRHAHVDLLVLLLKFKLGGLELRKVLSPWVLGKKFLRSLIAVEFVVAFTLRTGERKFFKSARILVLKLDSNIY